MIRHTDENVTHLGGTLDVAVGSAGVEPAGGKERVAGAGPGRALELRCSRW